MLKKWDGEIGVFRGDFGERRVAEFRKWGVDDISGGTPSTRANYVGIHFF